MINNTIRYRSDIDGLRALSVFAVILYHAEIKIKDFYILKGGFIGVDIFFIISGYLITKILLEKKVSLLQFFEKRIRRILPMLLFILTATSAFSWFYLLPDHFIDLAYSCLTSMLFLSNIFFWLSGEQYAAQSSMYLPLLHTWSLSVEGQYYVLYPFFIIFILRFFRKYKKIIFLSIILISLFIADFLSRQAPSLNFYLSISRIWELLLGGFLFFFNNLKINNNEKVNNFFSAIGFFIIILSFIFFYNTIRHPSLLTLIPILGAMLIIQFNTKKCFMDKILSNSKLVFFGKISFSLYLLHYPIFAFARYCQFLKEDEIEKKIFLIFVTFLLSIISYLLIEKPFRNNIKINNKKFWFSITILAFSLTFFSLYLIKNKGFPERFPYIFHEERVIKKKKFFKKTKCEDLERKICTFNQDGKKGSVVVIGDSHMQGLQEDLKSLLLDLDYSFTIAISYGQKDFFFNDEVNNNLDKKLNNILSNKEHIIILGGQWSNWLTETYITIENDNIKYFKEKNNIEIKKNEVFVNLEKVNQINIYIKDLLINNHKIILIYPVPEAGYDVKKKLNYYYKFSKSIEKYMLTNSLNLYVERNIYSFNLLDSFKNKNIHRIYPHKIFCDKQIKNRCITHDDKNIFYDDDNHLSRSGTKMLSEEILKTIKFIN